jgi:hypothetical protein
MALIDLTYFIGEINIAGTSRQEIADVVNHMIDKYEIKFLRDVLGIKLYNEYVAGIAVMPTPDQKWLDIRDGKEFQIGETWYRWRGLKEGSTTLTRKSIIANFVYYWYTRDAVSFQTPVSEASAKTENSNIVSPALKQSRAWNEMVDGVNELVFFLSNNLATYDSYSTYSTPYNYRSKINAFNL